MNVLFLLILAGFFTHEIDALGKREWRMLYGLRRLDDATGRQVFIWLHIPLVFGILWLTFSATDPLQEYSRIAVSLFALIHGFLHLRLRNHPENEFDLSSGAIIIGTALLGALYAVAALFPFGA